MEKIIYLENWTSSEQKITVGDRVLNMFFFKKKKGCCGNCEECAGCKNKAK